MQESIAPLCNGCAGSVIEVVVGKYECIYETLYIYEVQIAYCRNYIFRTDSYSISLSISLCECMY